MNASVQHYRFGVNYVPTQNWYYGWIDFDRDSFARDLDGIASLHADHIRIMPLWPWFQPNPTWTSPILIDRLVQVMELARQRNIDVCIALFNGHLTGQDFRPGYQREECFFTSPMMQLAQSNYMKKIAEATAGLPNFLGYDLGNELNCCWEVSDPSIGDRWHREMLHQCSTLAPHGVHVNGVDHQPWFLSRTFTPATLSTTQSIVPIHCYIKFTGALARNQGNAMAGECLHLIDAMASLVRSYGRNPTLPIWVQEYGMSEEWLDAVEIPSFLEKSTINAMKGGVGWFTWWASHDIDRKFMVNPLEYSLGLLTVDQKVKPQGDSFKELALAYAGKPVEWRHDGSLPPPPEVATGDGTWEWLQQYGYPV